MSEQLANHIAMLDPSKDANTRAKAAWAYCRDKGKSKGKGKGNICTEQARLAPSPSHYFVPG